MQNKIIVTIAITCGLAVGGVMVWIWKVSETGSTARQQATSTKPSGSLTQSASIADGSPLVLGVSSGDALSDSSLTGGNRTNAAAQSQGLGTAPVSNSQPSTTNSTGSANSDSATTDPAQFSMYDKYKDGQNGLFAELSPGNGAEATAGKKASVNYRGWLTNGQLFDQNMDSTKPFSFTIGAHNVIAGWEQTIAGMKVGGERLLIIPPAVGYGPTGQGPIPGNAVLVFYVKLLAVE